MLCSLDPFVILLLHAARRLSLDGKHGRLAGLETGGILIFKIIASGIFAQRNRKV